jgi:hypothetical protein
MLTDPGADSEAGLVAPEEVAVFSEREGNRMVTEVPHLQDCHHDGLGPWPVDSHCRAGS